MRDLLIAAGIGTALGALGAWLFVTEVVREDEVLTIGRVEVRIERGGELFLRDHVQIGIVVAAAGGAAIAALIAGLLRGRRPRR